MIKALLVAAVLLLSGQAQVPPPAQPAQARTICDEPLSLGECLAVRGMLMLEREEACHKQYPHLPLSSSNCAGEGCQELAACLNNPALPENCDHPAINKDNCMKWLNKLNTEADKEVALGELKLRDEEEKRKKKNVSYKD